MPLKTQWKKWKNFLIKLLKTQWKEWKSPLATVFKKFIEEMLKRNSTK